MIRAHAITGPKDEIARELDKMGDRVLEAIVFVDEGEPSEIPPGGSMFDEMNAHSVHVTDVDYSRESIYAPPPDSE